MYFEPAYGKSKKTKEITEDEEDYNEE